MSRSKRTKVRKAISATVLDCIIIAGCIGFIASIIVIVYGRMTIRQQVQSGTLKDVSALLEQYNKVTTLDITALFYGLVSTLLIGFGVTLFKSMQESATQAKNDYKQITDRKSSINISMYLGMITDSVSIAFCLVNNVYQCIVENNHPNLSSGIIANYYQILVECKRKIQNIDVEKLPVIGFQKTNLVDLYSQMRYSIDQINDVCGSREVLSDIDMDTLDRCDDLCQKCQRMIKLWKTTDFE